MSLSNRFCDACGTERVDPWEATIVNRTDDGAEWYVGNDCCAGLSNYRYDTEAYEYDHGGRTLYTFWPAIGEWLRHIAKDKLREIKLACERETTRRHDEEMSNDPRIYPGAAQRDNQGETDTRPDCV